MTPTDTKTWDGQNSWVLNSVQRTVGKWGMLRQGEMVFLREAPPSMKYLIPVVSPEIIYMHVILH